MKTSIPIALALALTSTCTLAQDGAGALSDPLSRAAGAVGEEHLRLAELAGKWDVKQSLWPIAGKAPQVDTGTAEFTVVVGGRALRQDLRLDSNPPFQGSGVIGYDNVTRTYFTSWMDVNFTDLLVLRGVRDERAMTYRLKGSMTAADGTTIPTREELQVVDRDHLVARYFETRNGEEAQVVELAYSRR